jgi:hypothetical protein
MMRLSVGLSFTEIHSLMGGSSCLRRKCGSQKGFHFVVVVIRDAWTGDKAHPITIVAQFTAFDLALAVAMAAMRVDPGF